MRTTATTVVAALLALLLTGGPPAAATGSVESDPASEAGSGAIAPIEQSLADAVPVEAQTDVVAVAAAAAPADALEGLDRVVVSADVPALAVIGVTWAQASEPDGLTVRMRTLESGLWTVWLEMEFDESEAGGGARGGTEPVAVLEATRVEVEVTAPFGEVPQDARVHVVDPGRSDADDDAPTVPASAPIGGGTSPLAVATLLTGVPQVYSRADWGADETIRTWRPELGEVTGAVIHHTAGRNDYGPEDVPAIIRGIYSYHAISREWGDIGYNAIVDKFGRIWEGRFGGVTHPVIGAHASGMNSTMFGISLMGDYSTVEVPDVAMRAMAQMTAWKFAVHGITPDGPTFGLEGEELAEKVIGHRDVALTACPGQVFYERMDELRDLIDQLYPTMPDYVQSDPHSVRLAGSDRFATSAATSQWIFRRPDVVYVATGFEYADALAASPAAALTSSPVLLVRPDGVPEAVAAELERMQPATIRVLGGEAAVSGAALAELGELAETVEVVAGVDRYETAALLSLQSWGEGAETVYLASGQSAPDALGAAAAAAEETAPLLLVKKDGVAEATVFELERLAPNRVVVVGGEAAVGDGVLAEIAELLPGATLERVGGVDRYATSALLVERLWDSTSGVFHATGVTWPDALSASSAAAEKGAPVLIVKTSCAPLTIKDLLSELDPTVEFVIGGSSAVSDGAPGRDC